MRVMVNNSIINYAEKEAQEKAAFQRMLAYQKKMEAVLKKKTQLNMHRKG